MDYETRPDQENNINGYVMFSIDAYVPYKYVLISKTVDGLTALCDNLS